MKIISVGFGGFLGALIRYCFSTRLNFDALFPWGTLTVNLVGSFFLALFLTVALKYLYRESFFVLAVSTGFTGSFTTFSALSVEAVKMAGVNPLFPLLYMTASFSVGLLLAFAGKLTGNTVCSAVDRWVMSREVHNLE